MYTEEEKNWVEKNTEAVSVPSGDVSVPKDESETEDSVTVCPDNGWSEVTNLTLLNVLNDVREDSNSIKYEMEQLNLLTKRIDAMENKLTKRINAMEFTVTEALRMCQESFVKIEQAVVACSIGYEKCKQGYEACKEGFAEVHELVDDFPNRIDCGVATGYL